jgi:hypothetical protein
MTAVPDSTLPGAGNRLVAVEVSPEPAQDRFGAAISLHDVAEELVAGDLAGAGDGLAELGLEGTHLGSPM